MSTAFKMYDVELHVHIVYTGAVSAVSEDLAHDTAYHIWRTESPHPFEQADDAELRHVIVREVRS